MDTFLALDLRVGRITEVETFPEARTPAWKLTVDFGGLGVRRSSAQITHYPADALTDRLVIAAINVGLKRIAGFTSECLVLGAIGDDDNVHLLSPDPGASPGDRIA